MNILTNKGKMPEKGKVEVLINRQERKEKRESGEERDLRFGVITESFFARKASSVSFAIETKWDLVEVLVTETFQWLIRE